jgi:hypothetical protein
VKGLSSGVQLHFSSLNISIINATTFSSPLQSIVTYAKIKGSKMLEEQRKGLGKKAYEAE